MEVAKTTLLLKSQWLQCAVQHSSAPVGQGIGLYAWCLAYEYFSSFRMFASMKMDAKNKEPFN